MYLRAFRKQVLKRCVRYIFASLFCMPKSLNSMPQKFYLPVEVVLNSLQTQKSLELVFRISGQIVNWPNFINRLSLFPKSFSKCIFFMLTHLIKS